MKSTRLYLWSVFVFINWHTRMCSVLSKMDSLYKTMTVPDSCSMNSIRFYRIWIRMYKVDIHSCTLFLSNLISFITSMTAPDSCSMESIRFYVICIRTYKIYTRACMVFLSNLISLMEIWQPQICALWNRCDFTWSAWGSVKCISKLIQFSYQNWLTL